MNSTSASDRGFHSVTFAVDAVDVATKPMKNQLLAEQLSERFRRTVLLNPNAQKPVAAVTLNPGNHDGCNCLVESVCRAFAEHRPLVLSPDCIWLVIAQGFAHHVAANVESLRSRLVEHQGSRELTADIHELNLKNFEGALACFSAQIRKASDPVLHETLLCNFSTTTPAIRTASEIVLLDAYSSYFTYGIRFICGIPNVTLTGSTADWQRIRARVEVLATYGLEWWVSRLRPILDECVNTVDGHPNLEFWQAICKPKRAYGATSITGWIADLFPYLGDSLRRRRSHVFEHPRENWALPLEHGIDTKPLGFGDPGAGKGVGKQGFPSGLASARMNLLLPDGKPYSLDLVAGFLGIEQNPEDLALSPLISWCVAEPPPQTPIFIP